MCAGSHTQSCVTLCNPMDLDPLSMEFFKQESWSGLPFLPPGDLPDPRIKLTSLESPVLVGRFFTTAPPGKPSINILLINNIVHFPSEHKGIYPVEMTNFSHMFTD